MFPIELVSIPSTETGLTRPPSIPLPVTFTVKRSADSAQIRRGLLKTSGSRWAPPRLPTQESDEADVMCVHMSTCPLPGEVKESRRGEEGRVRG